MIISMVNVHEYENTDYDFWSLFSTGSWGQEIHELFKTKNLEEKKQGDVFLIFTFKYDYLKVIHIHEAQLNMAISVYKLLRHPWVIR